MWRGGCRSDLECCSKSDVSAQYLPTFTPLDQPYPTQYSVFSWQDLPIRMEFTTAPPREGSMTTATRLGNVARLSFGAIASMGLLALPIAGSHPAIAQSHGPAALTGIVSSTEEGKMEGVVVSAKRPGSTIMVSVSTNAQGQYSFPQDRLAPGAYDITIFKCPTASGFKARRARPGRNWQC